MEKVGAERLLTEDEIAQAKAMLPQDWIGATVWANERIGGPTGLGVQALAQLAGWSDDERKQRMQDQDRSAAQTRANLKELRRTLAGAGVAVAGGLGLLWLLDRAAFLAYGFPAAFGAWALWMGLRANGRGGGGLLMIGIPLIIVSGLVIVATQDQSGQMSLGGLPVLFVALVTLSLGIAQAIFGVTASYAAPSTDRVVSSRRARRVTSVNLAVQAFVVQLAFYWLILRAGGLDEAVFNAAFRYLLFVPALGVALALSMAASSSDLRRAVIAAITPPGWCAAQVLLMGHGVHAFILQWALVDILIVLLAMPVGGLVVGQDRAARSFGFAAGLAGALVLGALAYGMVRLGALELMRLSVLAGWTDFALWIAAPALVVVLSGLFGRRNDTEVPR